MARKYRMAMDGKDMDKFLISTIGSFIQDRLINKDVRIQHKEQCAERLAAEEGTDRNSVVQYADQAVLANLDWGIDALEEAISTSNMETKLARLDYAEKMLQVCAMLNSRHKTAGVPNFYLSAWAHLNLAYLWKLRNNVKNSVLHILEMYIVDPMFSRIDFAPELWQDLFLPHMSSIVGWYTQERQKIVMEVIPDSSDLSFTTDFDQCFNESLIFSMRPDQAAKLQKLETLYGESLEENTRLYAKYYKDCMNFDSTVSKKGMPMLPIAEPPMTPLHEVSRSIPNYVKFGPILPKSAGFSLVVREVESETRNCRLIATSDSPSKLEALADQGIMDEQNEDDPDSESEVKNCQQITQSNMRSQEDSGRGLRMVPSQNNDRCYSPAVFSPVDSPRTPSPKVSSPKVAGPTKKPEKILRLLSSRMTDYSLPTSLPASPRFCTDASIALANSDGEVLEVNRSYGRSARYMKSMSLEKIKTKVPENSFLSESDDEASNSNISLPSSEKVTPRTRPPKDFVCPITSQLFCDPVTLETGQTYERKAIQEWLKRGNTTCPITRQDLSATTLPKTNYVLKRLVTAWKEQYPDLVQEFSYSETPKASLSPVSSRELLFELTPSKALDVCRVQTKLDTAKSRSSKRFMRAALSTSPTSVISQAALESVINELKPYTSCLCTSEDLQECEAAVLTIARIWREAKADPGVHAYLAKPTVVNGFVEILSASVNREVLRVSIYILSELIYQDGAVGETLTTVDSDFDCLAALLKNGLDEASVLIYQLRPDFSQLCSLELIPSLLQVIANKNEELDEFQMVIDAKDAAVTILEQILSGGDESSKLINALAVVSANGIPPLIKCLDRTQGTLSAVSALVNCMRAERNCRTLIASRADLSPVLELFHAGDDSAKRLCIDFITELVLLNRRTFRNKVLQIIRDEGAFSTMHSFLVYLHMAPIEQQPVVANLLLQLDLLVEPRKMSIYREEAVEALIEVLCRKEFPIAQTIAVDALLSLPGRLTASGKSLTEAWLLKAAGLDQNYNSLMKADRIRKMDDDSLQSMGEEEKAASAWEKRVAFVLGNHENGSIFKALEECLKGNSLEMAKSCLVVATWLTHTLTELPDTGVIDIARQCLLDQFLNVLQSSHNLEEKVLATLAIKSFINDSEALKELGIYAKIICKSLRKLKRCSTVAQDIMRALVNLPSVNAAELWSCTEEVEIDSSENGEVLSLIHLKGRIFSSHSDGHIKMWDTGRRALRLIQEVRGHTKAVTCLTISSSGDKLYSGSLDKTIRVWSIEPEEIRLLQVHDMKEAIHTVAANATTACFASQGTGAKLLNWDGAPLHINFSKTVKAVAMTEKMLYCGSTGYSIQEVDLNKCCTSTFYSGTRKLLVKQSIHALSIHDGLLFAGGSSVDGVAGKVFSLSTKATKGSFSTGFDIYSLAVNNDFVFTGTKCGIIEVWLRERLTRVASIKVNGGGHSKITSLVSDSDSEMLFAGTTDGKIQGWALD
ncbi:putative E3 ubiquitin-protein ligase LIN-1 [Aristolochia californica]|uniref:putative E3 ubiquitin-protein ligase LIN-1 n=1 Tax=Aristolochia californica TaxID=171875 RepID=UPI0035DEC7B3